MLIKSLGYNLWAGLRLALFLPVRRLDFRFGVAELVVLFLISALLDFGSDWIRFGPNAYFSAFGGGNEIFAAGLLLLTSALLGLAFRQPSLVVALPVVVLAALPAIQVAHSAHDAMVRWWPTGARTIGDIEWILTAWIVAMLVRAVAVTLMPVRPHRWLRSIAGGLLLAAPLWIAPLITPTEPWWRQPAVHGGADPRYPSPVSEPVLAAQATLLDDALAALEDERPGVTDLYFVAVGGVAREDVFRKDVESARKVMDERWDTKGRSIILLNNPRTLLQTPIASVTNLRETLNEIAGAMNTDEDVAMIYLSSHGAPGELEIALPPLELAPLTPAVLRTLLDEAGIKWRIVVVSSCFSGSFIPALQDDHTLVITAAQADRTSFGCGYRSDGTYFGEAFFEQGLGKLDSFPAALDRARERITEREFKEGFAPPSNPQSYVGAAMAQKLKELERGSTAGRGGRLVNWKRHTPHDIAGIDPQPVKPL